MKQLLPTTAPPESVPSRRGPRRQQEPQGITFRPKPEIAAALEDQAKALGVSPHMVARHCVTESLFLPSTLQALGAELSFVHQEIQLLRQDLSLIAEALLSSAGQVSEKVARTWVETNLNRD